MRRMNLEGKELEVSEKQFEIESSHIISIQSVLDLVDTRHILIGRV
jgi:hypothetical protein